MIARITALCLFIVLTTLVPAMPVVAAEPEVVPFILRPERGADPTVDYAKLLDHGPWDDKNYRLTASDLQFLPPSDAKLHDAIPAFFRVEIRKILEDLRGDISHYPRSALNGFLTTYKGYEIDGVVYRGVRKLPNGRFEILRQETGFGGSPLFLDGEERITSPNGAAESAIAINPVDPNKVIAGTNGPGSGQIMWRSSDGGETWTGPIALPDNTTCCDPTVAWSSNGLIAYTATLDSCGAACSVKFYRSNDDGATWVRTATLTNGGSDKEYIHVDTFPTSPFRDRIYLSWHNSNIQQFAFSSNQGTSFSTPVALDNGAAPNDFRGIGSDLTSDKGGAVYYFFPSTNRRVIRMLKSTDGGVTFQPGLTVSPTIAGFDFPIPSMETRKAFIYVAAGTDYSNGPFGNSLYASWTDSTAVENENNASANHARIQVAFSRDGGANWTTVTPHPTADANTVDRYNQWMSVDQNGRIHLIYYNTVNSVNRTGVDLYYTSSGDGGVTWIPEERVTAATSPNISDGFEWGDYNGMDMVLNDHLAIYTDNRNEGGGGGESVDVYAAGGFALTAPDFTLSVTPDVQDICAPAPLAPTTVSVRSLVGFVTPVALSAPALPAGFSGASFTPNPVTPAEPPATSAFALNADAGIAAGQYTITVRGEAAAITHEDTVTVNVSTAVPLSTTLLTPADGATSVQTSPTLTWSAVAQATGYDLEVSTDPTFTAPPVFSISLGNVTTFTLTTSLAPDTQHFWRVRARNGCGMSAFSAPFSFRTATEICFVGNVAIPDATPAGINSDLSGIAGNILDLNVRIEIPHTFVGDLTASLTHVGQGAARFLIDRPGQPASTNGCDLPNVNVLADDEGTGTIEAACSATSPAVGGVLIPNQSLSIFDGQDFAGTWRLNVADLIGQDVGNLVRWCLLPRLGAPPPPTDVAISKTGPANYARNTPISYTVTVTNPGPALAEIVQVTDTVPASILGVTASCVAMGTANCGTNASSGNNVSFTGASIGSGAGNSLAITIGGTVNNSVTGNIVNTATVALAEQTDSNSANNASTATSAPPPGTDLAVLKTGPANYVAGLPISYTITATNNGPAAALLFTIADTVPATITGVSVSCVANGTATCGSNTGTGNTITFTGNSVAAGAGNSVVLTVNGTVSAAAASAITNTATATLTSGQTETVPGNNTSSVTSQRPPNTDVAIAKAAPAFYAVGGSISYTLNVTNNGPNAAPLFDVADNVPASITGVSASCTATGTATCGTNASAGNAVSFTGNSLSSGIGNSLTIAISGTVGAGASGAIANTGSVTLRGAQIDSNGGNNSSTATSQPVPAADLAIAKNGPANYTPGGAISYTVVVTNGGPGPALSFAVADAVPAAVTGVTATCAIAGTGSCGTNASSGNNVSFTGASLSSGVANSMTITINGTVAAGTTGALANTATVTIGAGQSDTVPGNNSATSTAQLATIDVGVVKTGPANYTPGAAISYTVALSNAGPAAAADFSLADVVPASIQGVTASCVAAGAASCGTNASAGNNVSFTGLDLAVGAGNTLTITIQGTVLPGATGNIVNTATVSAGTGQTDTNAVNDSSTATTPAGSGPVDAVFANGFESP